MQQLNRKLAEIRELILLFVGLGYGSLQVHLPGVEEVDGAVDLGKVWPVLGLVVPTSQHELVHLVGDAVGGGHAVARVEHFACPRVGHSCKLIDSEPYCSYFLK